MLCLARRHSHGTTILVHPRLDGVGAAGGPARRLRARWCLVLLARGAALGAAPGAACPAGGAPAAAQAAGGARQGPRATRPRPQTRTDGPRAWRPTLAVLGAVPGPLCAAAGGAGARSPRALGAKVDMRYTQSRKTLRGMYPKCCTPARAGARKAMLAG